MAQYALPELQLAHIYGLVNGIHLTVFVILVFYSLSLYLYEKRYDFYKSLSLTAATLCCFSLFNLFAQASHDAITIDIIPAQAFMIAKYAAPIGLMLSVYLSVNYIQLLSLSGFRLVSNFHWYVIFLYLIDILILMSLFAVDDLKAANKIILINFIPHLLAVIVFCYVSLKDYRKVLISLYVVCLLLTIYMLHQMSQHTAPINDLAYALFQLSFCVIVVAVAFISLRYSHIGTASMSKARHLDPKRLIFDMVQSLESNEFYMVYQPKKDLMTDKICGIEALMRWQHPKHGFISPDEFINIAEYSNQLDELCRFAISKCTKQAKAFYDAGLDLPISINFSVTNIKQELVTTLLNKLQKYQLPSSSIVIELTESIMLNLDSDKKEQIDKLQTYGIKLSLDDYGTGFSSMGYLRDLHFYELKIDKSFIFDIVENQNSFAIVQSVIDMAKRLGIKVVAEGVEDKQTMELLRKQKCDVIQGYYLAKPMNVQQLEAWLTRQNVCRIINQNQTDTYAEVLPNASVGV